MLTEMIRVEPAFELRQAFAGWAIDQDPKVRTASATEFAVPPRLFVDIPEALLIGSIVDGHRYVSPDEDAELLGVATPEALLIGEAGPEVYVPLTSPAEEPVADSAPLDFAPLEDADADDGQEQADGFACDGCERTFPTERGRDTHRRMAHTEES